MLRQAGGAHEEAVTFSGDAPSFVDGPDDERLATAHIASGEDSRDVGHVDIMLGFDVGACVGFESELLNDFLFGPEEAEGEESELTGESAGGAGNFLRDEATLFVLAPFDLADFEALQIAVGIFEEAFGLDEIIAWVRALESGGFFLAVIHLVDFGPFGPGVVGGAFFGRLGQDFQLKDVGAALAQAGADAIRPGVSTPDDDDLFSGGVEGRI